MRKVWIIAKKEWAQVFRKRLVLWTVLFMPLLFAALPLIMLGFGDEMGMTDAAIEATDLPAEFIPLCEGLTGGECMQYYLLVQFMLFFLMIPMIVPMTFTSYSIVGEKTTRTLEPLLATPVTTLELLMGKMVAAAIPGVLATWLSFLLYIAGALILSPSQNVIRRLSDPLWLVAIFVVGPLMAVAAVSIMVMVSSRVTEPRVAEQISGLFVMPIVLLFVGQTVGLLIIDMQFVLWMALVFLVFDVLLVWLAMRVFQRENILTRWK